ncbi:hypothetical protein Vretimale_8696, partial [Volvox reticuliferus]
MPRLWQGTHRARPSVLESDPDLDLIPFPSVKRIPCRRKRSHFRGASEPLPGDPPGGVRITNGTGFVRVRFRGKRRVTTDTRVTRVHGHVLYKAANQILSGGRGGSAISQSLLRGGRSSGQSPIDALRLHPPQLLPRTQTRQKPQGRSWTGRRVVSRRNVHTVQGLRELEDAGVGGEEEEEKEVAAAATGRCSDVVSSPPHLQQFVTVVAGALSRTAAQVAVHPLDTLKTRMQVQVQNPQLGVWRAVMCCPVHELELLRPGPARRGARDLLLGLGAAIAGVLPASAVYFTVEPRIRS